MEDRGSERLSIRAEGGESLEEFVALVEELGAWLWQRGILQWKTGSNRAQLPLLRRLLEHGSLVMARRGADLVGGLLLTEGVSPEWSGRDGSALYLHKLVVARRASGRDLGRRLLAAADARVVGAGKELLRLDCWDGNDRLRRYYREAGFRELDAVPSHGFEVRLFERRARVPQ